MNIKESIAYIKPITARREPAHYVKEFTIDNETLGNIVAELERLWRIEECALLCQDINQSPGNTHCHDKLREALAAKGQL